MNPAVLLRLAREIGPQMVKLILKWAPVLFDKNNRKLLDQVWEFLKKAAQAQKGRTKGERLRRTLVVVQARAAEIEQRAETDVARERAERWQHDAKALLGALALLEVRQGRQRRADRQRISAEVDRLFAAVMEATLVSEAVANP
jgi:hypothetical protein